MQTNPPSVGNNVKLNSLGSAGDSIAYKHGFLNLKDAEPSLGIPPGYTFTQPNSVYYFLAFSTASSLNESRKFTGLDNLVFVNKNLGYNNYNPTYNVDISGNLRALSAYIPNLSAYYIIPASGINTLNFDYSNGVVFNTNISANKDAFFNNVTANYLIANFLSANRQIVTTIYTVYQLTGAYVEQNVTIAGYLSATNVFANSSISTTYLSALSANIYSLTANNLTVSNNFSANNIYANQIYGQIQIDPFCELAYNTNNQLTMSLNRDYIFAVRPSDDYSSDSSSLVRKTNGIWNNSYGTIQEDSNVLRPYFKTLDGVLKYVTKNGLNGNGLIVYIDQDIIEGEKRINYYTPEQSGKYAGCTTTGNLSAGFYSTEWLGANYPALTAQGLRGGDFLWKYDSSADISGVFSYNNFPELEFKNVNILGRYNISSIYSDNHTYYSSWRPYNIAPRKISYRTYVCANPDLKFGQFYNTATPTVSAWKTVQTKAPVQGRQLSFNTNTNVQLTNLVFEFDTNSNDSTGLVFYSGTNTISNVTVALLGTGVYTYGAFYSSGNTTKTQINGGNLGDPSLYTVANWGKWQYSTVGAVDYYDFKTPNYFPGYGLAIVGNYSPNQPTIINYGTNTGSTGFINCDNGAFFDKIDYGQARDVGRYSNLQSSIILDGTFNAYNFFQLGDNVTLQGSDQFFITDNFALSSRNIKSNNNFYLSTPTYNLEIYDDPYNFVNFKFINFNGSFSKNRIGIVQGYTNWAFLFSQAINTVQKNIFFNVYNNQEDPYYKFVVSGSPPYFIDFSKSLNSIGKTNASIQYLPYLTQTTMLYVDPKSLFNYQVYYRLSSPINTGNTYTLNFYAPSIR